ncbi:multicomponent Na+:H+ antiporter subunit C [Orenia metallireducens]|uniref:Multicomponent Na+:H+ antiporter subunit C n=1 Tax=Orenia metallireducens TaxID=1413210 RepID=A0A285GSV2_9FIRM|nr:cation:proton antiporter subunit C [Orenia metallireducens]PRX32632.1 multicomponent Na+:H+ antiporter subunit C [Orenia metallireducens]SNY26597.1 multicomponent Na+:H+ antiporter subunit C [Orenia metallireducens]
MELPYVVVIILFYLGIYTIIMNKNLIKIVVGVNIVESSLILLLILISFKLGGTAPILDRKYELVVDPIPQALALTAIVIGGSLIAVMLALVIKIYKRYGTLNVDEIRKLRG